MIGSLVPWDPSLRVEGAPARAPDLNLDPLGWLIAPAGLQTIDGGANAQALPATIRDLGVDKAPPFLGYAQTERVRWVEPFRWIEWNTAVDAGPFVWELWRIDAGAGEVLTIEGFSTYLQLQQGQAAPYFVTGPATDPLADLSGPGDELVTARWICDVTHTGRDPGRMLTQDPITWIPRGEPLEGLPHEWFDLRFAHLNRYTKGRQHVVPGPAIVRLFVVLQFFQGGGGGGASTRIRAGSMASAWRVAASGPTRAAVVASTRRS